METGTTPNLPPNDAQRSALSKLVTQQESMIADLEQLRGENTIEYKRLDQNAQILQNTVDSTKILRNIGVHIQKQGSPLFLQLDNELLSQEANHPVLLSLLSSTAPFVQEWNLVKDALATLLSVLKRPLEHVDKYLSSLVEELHNTETLRDQMAEAVVTLSTMIQTGLQSLKYKREGILHPLRRLPPEILLQIFHECVAEEVEDLRNQLPSSTVIQSPMILAGVCTKWRRIVLHHPRLWCYICYPISAPSNFYTFRFAHALSLSEGVPIELSITPLSLTPVAQGSLEHRAIRRLNIGNAAYMWPPNLPSPEYLWIGHEDVAPLTRTIPATLISRTNHIVCSNVRPVFSGENRSVETVVISGIEFGPFFGSMVRKLHHLRHVDMTRLRLGPLNTTFDRVLSHEFLSSLAIHSSALVMIELYLSRGLCLPSLRRLTLDGLSEGVHSPSNFSLMSSYFKETVTTFEISGISHSAPVQSWIETLVPLEIVVAYRKEATLPVLKALYKARDFQPTPPVGYPTKGVISITLREYNEDGTEVLPVIRDIRRNLVIGSKPIEIVLDHCLNILPTIRAEFSRGSNDVSF